MLELSSLEMRGLGLLPLAFAASLSSPCGPPGAACCRKGSGGHKLSRGCREGLGLAELCEGCWVLMARGCSSPMLGSPVWQQRD